MKKMLLLAIVFFGFSMLFFMLISKNIPVESGLNFSRTYPDHSQFEECILDASTQKNIIPGDVILRYSEYNQTDVEKLELAFGLNRTSSVLGILNGSSDIYFYKVPIGSEYYWYCKLKNYSGKFESVELRILVASG